MSRWQRQDFAAPGPLLLRPMHIPRWILWPLLYAAATFAWMVYFEYGHDGDKYQNGALTEWGRMWNAVSAWVQSLQKTA